MGSQQRAILLGALVTGLLFTVFSVLNPTGENQAIGFAACCLPSLLGPLMAIRNYATAESLSLSTGEGAKIGLLTGAGGGLIGGVMGLLLRAIGVLPSMEDIIELTRDRMAEAGAPPEQVDGMIKAVEMFSGSLGIVISVVALAIVGAIVGMIGAAIFKKGDAGVV